VFLPIITALISLLLSLSWLRPFPAPSPPEPTVSSGVVNFVFDVLVDRPRIRQDFIDDFAYSMRSHVDRPSFHRDSVVENRLSRMACAFQGLSSASESLSSMCVTHKACSIAARVRAGARSHWDRVRSVVYMCNPRLLRGHARWERQVKSSGGETISRSLHGDYRRSK
jgi:hypothetical protein